MNDPSKAASRISLKDVPVGVMAAAFFILMVDGFDSLVIAYVAPLISEAMRLEPTDIGKLFAASTIGSIFGALVMGPLADRHGRKPILIIALIITTVTTFACAAAETFQHLAALRFLAGIGLGGALVTVIALAAESIGPERRASAVTLLFIGFPLGAGLGGALTSAVLHTGWQMVFVYTGVACLLATAAAFAIPEMFKAASARRKGGHLTNGSRHEKDAQLADMKRLNLLRNVLADGRLWPALCLWVGFFSMMTLTSALMAWMPSLVVARGETIQTAAITGAALSLGGIAGALSSIPMINRRGPYLTIAAMALIGSFIIAMVGNPLVSETIFLAMIAFAGFCLMGAQLNFPGTMVDLFPLHVRGSGSGISMAIGRLGSIVGPLGGGQLIAWNLSQSAFFLLCGILALMTATAVFATAWLRRNVRREVHPLAGPGSARSERAS